MHALYVCELTSVNLFSSDCQRLATWEDCIHTYVLIPEQKNLHLRVSLIMETFIFMVHSQQ